MNETSQKTADSPAQTQPSGNVTFPGGADQKQNQSFGIGGFLKNRPALILFLVLAIIVAIGGVYAYNNIYFAPEKVLSRTLTKMQEVTSFGIDGKVAVTANTENSETDMVASLQSSPIVADITGRVDYKDKSNLKSEFNLDVKSGLITFLTGKVRVLNQNSYLYLDNIDGLELAILGGDSGGFLTFLTGNWIKIDGSELRSYGYDGSEIAGTTFDTGKIVSLLAENNPVKIISQLPSERIDDQDMFHYGFELNQDALKAFLSEFQKLVYQEEPGPAAQANVEDVVGKISLLDGQIWIGKNDYYLHKISFGVSVAGTDGESTSWDIDLKLKDVNGAVDIEVPDNAETVKSILGKLASPAPELQPTF